MHEMGGEETNQQMLETARAHERILDAAEAGDIFAYRGAVNDHYKPLESIIAAFEAKEAQEGKEGAAS